MAHAAQPPQPRWTRWCYIVWTLVGIGLLVAASGWVFGKVSRALVPFLFALVIIYLFRSPVAALESRGMKRGVAVGICYVVFLGAVALVLGFAVPPLVDQLRAFVAAFPDYYDRVRSILLDFQTRYQTVATPPWLEAALANIQSTITRQSASWSQALATQVFNVGGSALSLLTYTVFSLVIAFWALKDFPVIMDEVERLAGPSRRSEIRVLFSKVSDTLGGYLRGQVVLATVTAVVVSVGLRILDVPYSMVIGMLAGALNPIPWIGPAIVAVIAGVAGATVGPWYILWAMLVVAGTQQLSDLFVQPRVMSERVDLHPLLVIFSILAGSTLFGLVGLVLAIPVAAIAKALFVHYFEKHTQSRLTTAEGALFRSSGAEETSADEGPQSAGHVAASATVEEPAEGATREPGARGKRTDTENGSEESDT